MPDLTPQTRTRLAAAAAAVVAAIGVGAVATRDYSDRTTAILVDAGISRAVGSRRGTDLLTGPVAPGAEAKTGVNLPLGARVSSVMPAGQFAVVSQSHTDNDDATWFEIVVRNDGPAPLRFVGFIEFTVP